MLINKKKPKGKYQVVRLQGGGVQKDPKQKENRPKEKWDINDLLDYLDVDINEFSNPDYNYNPWGQELDESQFSGPLWDPEEDSEGKVWTQGLFTKLKPLQKLERIDIPLTFIESPKLQDLIINSPTSLKSSLEGRDSFLVMKRSRKTKTGQIPNYYAYWDEDKKQWNRRPVEKEEKDYYMKENRIRKPQVIKASF